MNNVTAIILSAQPVTLTLPGVDVLGSVQTFKTPEELHGIRLDVIKRVKTPFCFYFDDDDKLPDDYLSVLDECMGKNQALAYTHEIVKSPSGKERISATGPYCRNRHLKNPMFVHHLAVMRTADAVDVAKALPRGQFSTEQMLYMAMANRGAAYVDRIGYIWHQGIGFSTKPKMLVAQVATATWCNRSDSWHS